MQAISSRLAGNTAAAAAIEFALIAPILVLTTIGTIQLSIVLFAKHQLSDGVDRARRALQIDPTRSTQTIRDEIASLYFFSEDQVEVTKQTVTLTSGEILMKLEVRATVDFRINLLSAEWSSLSVDIHVPM